MLAPRKKLWSTPPQVLDTVCQWTELQASDMVVDVGCGDGRVIKHLAADWTSRHTMNNNNDDNTSWLSVSFLGLDINPERIQEATVAIQEAKDQGQIHPQLSIQLHCTNALEATHLLQEATVVFLYLIPRGLKLFKPILYELLQHRKDMKKKTDEEENQSHNNNHPINTNINENDDDDGVLLRVITYMSPLPEETYIQKELCQIDHQPGSSWPVYLYHLKPR